MFPQDHTRPRKSSLPVFSSCVVKDDAVKSQLLFYLTRLKLFLPRAAAVVFSPLLGLCSARLTKRCHFSTSQSTWINFISGESGETSPCQHSQAGQSSPETNPLHQRGPGLPPTARPICSALSQIRSHAMHAHQRRLLKLRRTARPSWVVHGHCIKVNGTFPLRYLESGRRDEPLIQTHHLWTSEKPLLQLHVSLSRLRAVLTLSILLQSIMCIHASQWLLCY